MEHNHVFRLSPRIRKHTRITKMEWGTKLQNNLDFKKNPMSFCHNIPSENQTVVKLLKGLKITIAFL